MRDPWKYLAFPAAAVTGYILSATQLALFVGQVTGLADYINNIIVVALTGLVAGFMVDEVIPAYVEKVHGKQGAGGDLDGDFGGGGDFDSDFDME